MKLKYILFLLCLLGIFLIGNVDALSFSSNKWSNECYQEIANTSNNCSNSGGSYAFEYVADGAFENIANCYDGSYSTYCRNTGGSTSEAIMNITYQKPNIFDGLLWRVKYDSTELNLTLNSSCLLQSPIKLRVRNKVQAPEDYTRIYFDCYNGSNWLTVYLKDGYTPNSFFYEEGITWLNISSENLNFTGNQNITRYLQIPSSVSALINGFLNLSGLNMLINNYNCTQGISSSCSGNSPSTTTTANYASYTYIKPFGALQGDTLWHVKHGYDRFASGCSTYNSSCIGNYNITLPIDCWNYDSNLNLRIYGWSEPFGDLQTHGYPACYNGTDWRTIGNSYDGFASAVGSLGDCSLMWDNDFSTFRILADLGGGYLCYDDVAGSNWESRIYEQEIFWNINNYTIANLINPSLFINGQKVWNYSGVFNQTNNRTSNLASTINRFLNATYLIGSNYIIPFVFHSDTAGILQYLDLLFNNLGFIGNSQSYNTSTYETSSETFILNTTYDLSEYTSISGTLYYDGIGYSGTRTGSTANAIFTKVLDIPTIASQTNKTFYWIIALTNSSGTTYYNTSLVNQTVSNISLSLCGGVGGNVPYINFTFKDETTDTYINASTDLSTWSYYLGSGGQTKSLIFTNTSVNPSYAYCFNGGNRTLQHIVTYQYSGSGYPQRQYYQSGSLTNATTNKVLYLLGTGGGYSSIQIVNSANIPISGVTIQVERQFSGVWTVISQSTSDSSGLVTFYLNPSYDHRITATKTGYSTTQVTIKPSQSVYTITMSSTSGNVTYTSNLDGIDWLFKPSVGLIGEVSTNFNVTITASKSNIISCRFDLTNLTSTIDTTTSSCNSTGGTLALTYTPSRNEKIYGSLYLDLGDGLFLVDGDAYWIAFEQNVTSIYSLKQLISDLSSLNEFGEGVEGEFTKIVLFFLVLSIIMGIICFYTGYDFAFRGAGLYILYIFFLFAGISGWFELEGVVRSSPFVPVAVATALNKYIYLVIISLLFFGYVLNDIRRES